MNLLTMTGLGKMMTGAGYDPSPTRASPHASAFMNPQFVHPAPKATTPSSSSASRSDSISRGEHVMRGLAQMMVHQLSPAARRAIAVPPYKPGMKPGVGDITLEPGDYHIVGTQVQLRSGPSAKASVIGVLQSGENIYVFGETETDPAFMLGPNNEAVPNDGSDPGIVYARIGTQTHGSGWVAAYFIAGGAGTQVQPQPPPAPVPSPSPTPAPEKKSYVVPVLVGGSIGAAVLLGAALLYRANKKSHRAAYA